MYSTKIFMFYHLCRLLLFSQFGMSDHMIMSSFVNANHPLSNLLVSTDHSYGRKYLTPNVIISYLTIKHILNISYEPYESVSNFISIQNWSALCINIRKTNNFFLKSYEL